MMHKPGALFAMLVLGVGCGVGDEDVTPRDPNPEKMICTDAFKLTGTFVAGTPGRDADSPTGCWPVGTWNFTVALDPSDDNIRDITGDQKPDRCGAVSGTKAATFDTSFSYVITRTMDMDGWIDSYALSGAVNGIWNGKTIYRLKLTEGGGLECEGGIELYSADGTEYWNMKPQQGGTTINGFGDYVLYKEPKN